MVKYFIKYLISYREQFYRDEAYRLYITDSIYYRGQNKALTIRYEDLFKPQDTRSGDEIAADIIKRMELKV